MAKGDRLHFELDDDDLKLFYEEAVEQMELLDSALVELESAPSDDLLQQIFRAAHTLKGSAATIGHMKMAGLTHAMETLLDAIRQGQLEATSPMVDMLLAGLDALRELTEEVVTLVDSGTEVAHIEEALLHFVSKGGDEAPAASASQATHLVVDDDTAASMLKALDQGQGAILLHIEVAPNCELPSIRCFQALQELDALGTVAAIQPSRDVVESGEGDRHLTALLSTSSSPAEVEKALDSVADIAAMQARAVEREELPGTLAFDAPDTASDDTGRPRLEVVEPASPDPDTPASDAKPSAKKSAGSVRIDVERLDGLMNLVGELVIDRTRLQQIREHLSGVLKEAHLSHLTENFEETTNHLARITDELQDEIMRSRMLPVRSVLSRLPRLVRDVATKCGKRVELVTAGEDTELDRSVIEEISDPLVHILRNAIDHGLESPDERVELGKPAAGTVSIKAWNQETYIYLSISDDGRGIDTTRIREKVIERGLVTREVAESAPDDQVLQYIFLPGLSTAKEISDVSGRGVGMDIVRANIERLNGEVTVRSTPGEGTEFTIQLPLTLATTKALMVTAKGIVYAVPLVSVTEALPERDGDIHQLSGQRTLRLRGQLLPMVPLAEALGDYRPVPESEEQSIVAARHGDRQVAFLVDRILGEQDVVVKALGDFIGTRKGLTGATILGDGSLGLILDAASLISDQPALAAAS